MSPAASTESAIGSGAATYVGVRGGPSWGSGASAPAAEVHGAALEPAKSSFLGAGGKANGRARSLGRSRGLEGPLVYMGPASVPEDGVVVVVVEVDV